MAGRKLLTGLLCVLPDNKIVEDIHGRIRIEAKSHPNAKLTANRIQEIVVRSNVFESRGIRHAAALSRDVFARNYKSYKRVSLSRNHFCQKHQMHPRWIRLVGKRSWKPMTEEGSHSSQAAFRWLIGRPQGETLEKALFSRLVFPFVVIRSAGLAYASLGNASWAVLAWPLALVDGGFVFQQAAGVCWVHVTDPSQWEVIDIEGVVSASVGVVMKPVHDPLPLIQYFASRYPLSSKINFQDVCRIAVHLGIADVPAAAAQSRDQLMKSICEHFGDLYEPKKKSEICSSESLGMLDEAVFDELDRTEQLEFPDIDKTIRQRKARRVAASFKFEKAVEKGKAKAKKRKAKTGNAARAKRQRRQGAENEAPGEDDPPGQPEVDAGFEVEPVVPLVVPPMPAVEVLPAAVDAAADDAPAPAAAVGAARGALVRHHEGYIPWEELVCEICGVVAGQYKLERMPGGRDQPTWHMRVRQRETMEWASRAPLLRSRRTSVVGDENQFALTWIQSNRHCHPAAAAAAADSGV